MGNHKYIIEGIEYEVSVGPRTGNSVQVSVNGRGYDVEVGGASPAAATAAPAPRTAARSEAPTTTAPPPSAPGGRGDVRAPISGVVLRIDVQPGQKVTRGTVLLILEAMKMENEIISSLDGVVQSLGVKPQQDVREGDMLVVIVPS